MRSERQREHYQKYQAVARFTEKVLSTKRGKLKNIWKRTVSKDLWKLEVDGIGNKKLGME